MDLKHIKELMSAMGRAGIKNLNLKKEGFELNLERECKEPSMMPELWTESEINGDQEYQTIKKMPHQLPSTKQMHTFEGSEAPTVGTFITSPMVGIFYTSPSPDEAVFVKVGDKIEKTTVVCIIEAMKVMNEIKAHQVGVVAEVLVEAGSPVEFGTKLFRII